MPQRPGAIAPVRIGVNPRYRAWRYKRK